MHSSFTQEPHESFHQLQDGWRKEIEEVLLDLRRKEKVSLAVIQQLRDEFTKANKKNLNINLFK